MISCLLLDNSDIRRHFYSSEILLFSKGCCLYTSVVPENKYKNYSANCFKMSTFIQQAATFSFVLTSETKQR